MMSKNNDHEFEEMFNKLDNDSNNSYKGIIRKARLKTLLRNILISIVVSCIVLVGLSFGWLKMMEHRHGQAIANIELFNRVTKPNVHDAGYQDEGNGLFEGILYFQRYKMVDGIPVQWSDQVVTYSLFGGVSQYTGHHSPIQIEDENDGMMRIYDRYTKQRVMQFYHPELKYDKVRNDLKILNQIENDKKIEIAISFDQKYSPEQVRDFLPKEVSLEWYWVDTYSNLDEEKNRVEENGTERSNSPELAGQIYGFTNLKGFETESEKDFIRDISFGASWVEGKYHGEFKRIYDYLRGSSSEINEKNLKILGVVVSGSKTEIETLQDIEQVRSAVLGVVADKY